MKQIPMRLRPAATYKGGAPRSNQNAKLKPGEKRVVRKFKVQFTPALWEKWHNERYNPDAETVRQSEILANGIKEFRSVFETRRRPNRPVPDKR